MTKKILILLLVLVIAIPTFGYCALKTNIMRISDQLRVCGKAYLSSDVFIYNSTLTITDQNLGNAIVLNNCLGRVTAHELYISGDSELANVGVDGLCSRDDISLVDDLFVGDDIYITGEIEGDTTVTGDFDVTKAGDAQILIFSNVNPATADAKMLLLKAYRTGSPADMFWVDSEGDITTAFGDVNAQGYKISGTTVLDNMGIQNIFVGDAAGNAHTSGNDNAFLGYFAGVSNTTGSDNTFIGCKSGYSNVGGDNNTYVGYSSGWWNTEGNFNTGLGWEAGYLCSTGIENTMIGSWAGYNVDSGSGNIFLGYKAGYNETGDNKLYIDNSNTATPLIYGDFNTDDITIYGNLHTAEDLGVCGTTRLHRTIIYDNDLSVGGAIDADSMCLRGALSTVGNVYLGGDAYITGDLAVNGGDITSTGDLTLNPTSAVLIPEGDYISFQTTASGQTEIMRFNQESTKGIYWRGSDDRLMFIMGGRTIFSIKEWELNIDPTTNFYVGKNILLQNAGNLQCQSSDEAEYLQLYHDDTDGYIKTGGINGGNIYIQPETTSDDIVLQPGGVPALTVTDKGACLVGSFSNTENAYIGNDAYISGTLNTYGAGDVQIGTDSTESDLYFPADHADIKGDGSTIIDFGVAGDEFGFDVANVDYKFSTLKGDGDITIIPTGDDLTLGDGVGAFWFRINGIAGQFRGLMYETNGSPRWHLYTNAIAESGSNAGSDFAIKARTDAGDALLKPFYIKRSNGYIGLGSRAWMTTTPSTMVHIGGDNGTIPTLGGSALLLINNNSAVDDIVSMSLISGTAATSGINFGSSGDENAGIIFYDNNTDTLKARAGGSGIQLELTNTNLKVATSTFEVTGKEVDIGDAGGFSGMKFNSTSTQLEFWIDGSLVSHITSTGEYVDATP